MTTHPPTLTMHLTRTSRTIAWRSCATTASVGRLGDYADATGEPVPPWVTAEQIARTLEHLRPLGGRWQATAFGATMTLRFCAGDLQGGGGA